MSKSNTGRVIKINPETLKTESEKIRGLSDNKDLSSKVDELKKNFKKSNGYSVNELDNINFNLEQIVTNMNLLFTRTADFLDNTATNFVVVDEAKVSSASGQDK